jgi:O-antigen/teichoic acid export membrane protein
VSKQDALACLFNQGIVSVAGFATSVLIGRQAPAELGIYFIGLSLVVFARGFQQQLVSTPYTIYHHRQTDSEMAAYRGSCLVQQFMLIAITLVYLVIQIMAAWTGWVSAEVVPSLIVLLIFIPAILMREVVRHYCFTHSKNTSVLGIDLAISVLQISTLFAFGYMDILSGATAWIAVGLSCVLALGYWYVQSGPAIEFQRQRLSKDWKLNWSFGKWAVSGQLVGSLPTYLLPWLLLIAVGAEGTGFFAACMALVGVANIFNTGMLNYITPKAAKVYVENGITGLSQLMVQLYLLFFLVVGSFLLLLVMFGDSIAVMVYSENYVGLQTVLNLLAIAKLFEGFSHAASGGLFAMERIKANFWVDVILMLVTITAAVLLIRPLGVLGAAWTTLIGSATGAILRSVLLVTFLRQKS